DSERLQSSGELEASAADIGGPLGDLDAAVREVNMAWLIAFLTFNQNRSREDHRASLFPRRRQAAVSEELVEPDLPFLPRVFHAWRRTTRSASCFSRSPRSSKPAKARCAAWRSRSAISRDRTRP